MKAITIRQPFASLIMAGIKTVETRSQDTKFRGRILIHSALKQAKFTEEMVPFLMKLPGRYVAKPKEGYTEYEPILWVGHIIGSVEIMDSKQAGDWIEANRMKAGHADYEREWSLGDLSTDRWAWTLKDPRPLKNPIPAKGQQGFWNFECTNEQGREFIDIAYNHAQ